ncbi:hypothetical protein ACFSTC_48820 [Nonomuraea ferruginea]
MGLPHPVRAALRRGRPGGVVLGAGRPRRRADHADLRQKRRLAAQRRLPAARPRAPARRRPRRPGVRHRDRRRRPERHHPPPSSSALCTPPWPRRAPTASRLGLIADGPYTTDVASQITEARQKAKKAGFSYDSIFQAGDHPVYALRTGDGGAIIQYSLSRTTTTTTKTAEDDYIPVPDSARWSISAPVVRRNLRLTEIHTYVTAVPRRRPRPRRRSSATKGR